MTRTDREAYYVMLSESLTRKARTDLLSFTVATMPNFDPAEFHRRYYARLTDFARGDIDRLMVFVPPQHGKSEGSTRRLPAFVLGQNPDMKIAIVSYSVLRRRESSTGRYSVSSTRRNTDASSLPRASTRLTSPPWRGHGCGPCRGREVWPGASSDAGEFCLIHVGANPAFALQTSRQGRAPDAFIRPRWGPSNGANAGFAPTPVPGLPSRPRLRPPLHRYPAKFAGVLETPLPRERKKTLQRSIVVTKGLLHLCRRINKQLNNTNNEQLNT